ncbi:uroporphyrinogen III synthase [Rhizobium leguminosarum bv. trifolii CB782]|uniref:Uroporphyrinogen-III synthase n=1 Tax=Rhizobium hidalgonense TaxID=1538159 RepID=A0A2A6KIM4_9HYPH|nr:uroporphyrinogen-III synthase [Rhizobium hidalgonense]AHG47229.1 uroporphyrinogen III synthase [Rhizobium leguminosarum bv. trifolii CB782]MDR9773874.1 uroporphyrinogen-III synthase [Rhizobium hidalgonense]MDR9810800.1 uroporphyrinogen-III synthase [Rhizobium hidalgonense]MDR9819748.1 uroporphyrinogen-III synthase [Rhizobium hidalgonense]PDT24360.1 uroporphyrinogen III synthase [Rhizobium hidalgonense]
MRVLVTRPAHSATKTAQRLRDMGHEPLLLALRRPVHDSAAAAAALARTSGAIAVTSAEAVRVISVLGETLRAHLARPLFAVGEMTAEAARSLGFQSVASSSGNGGDLADLVAARGIDDLLYLAGLPRAETFEAGLRQRGIRFSIGECYRMQPIAPGPAEIEAVFAGGRPDAVLFYSRQTADDFFGVAELRSALPEESGIRLLCLSEAVAEAVPAALKKNAAIAPMPDEKSLLSLL